MSEQENEELMVVPDQENKSDNENENLMIVCSDLLENNEEKKSSIKNKDGESDPAKKNTTGKLFRKQWMGESIFKGWLKPVKNNRGRCMCRVCGVVLKAGHSELKRHASAKKHRDRMLSKSKEWLNFLSVQNKNTRQNEGDSLVQDEPASQVKRKFTKRFKNEWMFEPIFRGWLKPVKNNPERCLCTACGVVLLAGHSELEKHAAGRKHCLLLERQEKLDSDMAHDKQGSLTLMKKDDFDPMGDLTPEVEDQKPRVIKISGTDHLKNLLASGLVKKTAKIVTPPTSAPPRTNLILARRPMIKKSSIPEIPDPKKLIEFIEKGSDEEMKSTEEDEESPDEIELPSSESLIREMRAGIALSEKQIKQEKQRRQASASNSESLNGRIQDIDAAFDQMTERELEARLNVIAEKRRQNLNIYKLKLLEMTARVRKAEAEEKLAKELHELKVTKLKLQIQREEPADPTELPDIGS